MKYTSIFNKLGVMSGVIAVILLSGCGVRDVSHQEAVSRAPHPSYPQAKPAAQPMTAAIHASAETVGVHGSGQYLQPNYDALDREEYNKISENQFLAVLENPMSTFSIDVDTAAYSNVRRFINQGSLPPVDAVRIEEMINYFDYDYPAPKVNVPFSITTESGPAPWKPEHKLVHIGLKGKVIDEAQLPAANLVFLIDVSGSMSARLPLVKSSMKLLVKKMRPQDRVAIVVYAGAAGLVLESTSGNDKETIYDAIDNLQAGGSTAGGAGIKLAYKVALDNFKQNGNNRVILASDGDFNVGSSSQADLQKLIENKRESGVFLTVLGFGMGNYRDGLAETLANKGNGNYAYIDSMQEAKKILVNEFGGTIMTIAKDVKLQIQFNPAAVKSYRLIGYENRLLRNEDFDNDKKDAGELGSGHTVTAIYEVISTKAGEKIKTGKSPRYIKQEKQVSTADELMYVKFRYKEPDADKSKLIEKIVKRSDDQSDSHRFQLSAAVAEFGMLLRNSQFKGKANYQQVISLARAGKGEDKHGYRSQFITIVETAEEIAAVK